MGVTRARSPGPATGAAPEGTTGERAVAAAPARPSRAASVEERWETFHRYGPFALFGVGLLITEATEPVRMSVLEDRLVLLCGATVLALQVWCTWARPGRGVAGAVYYFLRWALAFVLTWCNPFFAVFAILGYFDADRYVPHRRLRQTGLLLTAVIMAGSNAGGFPLAQTWSRLAFPIMLTVHATLCFVFVHLGNEEEARRRAQAGTIAELERTNARLEAALEENAGLHSQLLVQAREAGVADERRRLAAEIHDTIAQGLTGIITQLQATTATVAADPAGARAHLDRAASLARYSLGEARRSVRNLGPAALEIDALPEALAKTVAAWAERTGVSAAFTLTGTAEPLPDEIASTLLRIAEEALSNTARHAAARRLGVTLSYMDGEIALDVRDDGHGFDPAAARDDSAGYGLDGMRARAERVAGILTVESEQDQGTAVSARVPLPRDATRR